MAPVRQRARDRATFLVERLMMRGLRYRLLLAALIVAAVAGAGGVLLYVLDPGSGGLSESVWWAFLRLTDPGYLGDDEGVARRTISTVVTVLGYLLFLGLLIAILTQWLNERIAALAAGTTPVVLSDHVILLGWTQHTPTIAAELLRTGGRLERFLAQKQVRSLRIVILAEHVDEQLVQTVRERLDELWDDRRVLIRSGTPLRRDHLERVGFRDAAVVILTGADFGEGDPSSVDAQVVKTLLTLSKNAARSGASLPLAVGELFDGRKAVAARRAYGGECEIVASDDLVSRLIAQSVRQRGLCAVFDELLTLNVGNALHVRRVRGQGGRRFHELRALFSKAVLLGTIKPGAQHAALDPDPKTIVEEDDFCVFLARSFEDCEPDPAARDAFPDAALVMRPAATEGRRRVLILGWSRKVPALLREFERYGESAFEVVVVGRKSVEAREAAIERGPSEGRANVRHIEADITVPGVLESLDPEAYDNIILMARERYGGEEEADATTLFVHLSLMNRLSERGQHPEVLVELLDRENQFLVSREYEDVIVSPMISSYVLSQVSLRRELAAVIAELSRPWGPQIVLQPVADYGVTGRSVRFEEIERIAAEKGEIAIGVRLNSREQPGLRLNPGASAEFELTDADQVLALARFAEPA